MVLVNGADGIGTGWMTKIPNYNPREIVHNLRRMLNDEEPEPMVMMSADENKLISGFCCFTGCCVLRVDGNRQLTPLIGSVVAAVARQ